MKAFNVLKTIVRTVLVVVLVAATGFIVALNVIRYTEKKAVIFVPGLLASGFVNEETGKPVWDPFVSEWNLMDLFDPAVSTDMIGELAVSAIKENILTDFIEGNENSIFMQIAMDEEGNPINENVVPADWDTCRTGQKYGAFRSFQRAYEAVAERYKHSGADIRIYNYDWRIDNRKNSENLEKFINDKGYDKVVLIGHSMGNVVISNYLARNAENRNKTMAHLSYAGPLFGSLSALTTLEDFDGMASFLYDIADSVPVVGASLKQEINRIFDEQFRPLGMHLPTIVQLLPSPEMFDTPYCEGDKSFLYVDGKPIKTKAELLEFYKTRTWSYKDDGSGLKTFVADLEEYWDSFYVETPEGKKHASTLVPTYYFAGVGTGTAVAAHIDGGKLSKVEYDKKGDGTVLYYSATLNNEDNLYAGKGAGKSTERFAVSVPVVSHFECGCEFKNETERETFAYLDDIL